MIRQFASYAEIPRSHILPILSALKEQVIVSGALLKMLQNCSKQRKQELDLELQNCIAREPIIICVHMVILASFANRRSN